MLNENDFDNILATFCCYEYGVKASGAVQKIAAAQKAHKVYRKCSPYVIICRIAKIYLLITDQQQWKMVGYKDTSDGAKKAAKVAQKKEQ